MNANDAFPESNLPPESQEWRRSIEQTIYELLNASEGEQLSIQGLNRNAASSLETLAGQIRALSDQVERVEDLYDALPLAIQRTATETNFGLSSSSWNTVATITFTPPKKGVMQISAMASGQLVSGSTTTNMEIEVRLLQGADASPTSPGLPASPDGVWQNNFVSQWGWTSVPCDPETPVVVRAQIDPVTAASWGSGTGSFVALSGFATFVAT
jgi:hypothetical protein